MKVLVTEKEGGGLVGLIGKRVTIFCMNYFYHGVLAGVGDTCVKLTDAHIVYETGPFTDANFKHSEKISDVWYVATSAIESFGVIPNR